MSIATEVTRISNAKTAIKNAINAKGGTLTSELIDEYAEAISDLPSGATDTYYKCASITPATEGGIIVSGAGTSAFNGTYDLFRGTGTSRIWFKRGDSTGEYDGGHCIKNYGSSYGWVLSTNYSGYESQDQPYYITGANTDDPWTYTWQVSYGGSSPAPTVTYQEGTAATWSGYLATIASTGITYASSVTSGLSYSSTTPVVNGIYNADVTKRIYEDTLLPGNVKKDVSLFGITGTYEGSGGATDFYKCATVTEAFAGGIEATGAGDSTYNGKYAIVDSTATGDSRVWKHTTNERYLLYSSSWGWFFYTANDPTATSPAYGTGSGSSGSDPWDKTFATMAGTSPAPAVTEASATSATWTGYKAILSSGVYTFESTATSGLTYSTVTPVVGKCYADGALVQANLYEGMPTSGLFLYIPLTTDTTPTTSETTVRNSGTPTSVTNGGLTCIQYSGTTASLVETSSVPTGVLTLSMWFRHTTGTNTYVLGINDITFEIVGSNMNVYQLGSSSGSTSVPGTNWVHIAVTIDSDKKIVLYYNGSWVYTSSWTYGTFNYSGIYLNKRCDGSNYSNVVNYYKALRVYNRVLTLNEIATLAAEFTPTNA